jgi:outer membrane lipoprotein-sorting protein
LDKISDKYDAYKSVEIQFDLIIKYPDQPIENQKASITQQGKSFLFTSPQQDIYGNGKNIWYYIKERNEVQLNNFDEGDDVGMLTPKDLLKQYKANKFEYALVNEDGSYAYVEFKPLDSYDDYSKYRVKISKTKMDFESMEAFGKDGSKIDIKLSSVKVNQSYPTSKFVFDIKAHPGVFVEDLRID